VQELAHSAARALALRLESGAQLGAQVEPVNDVLDAGGF
jgi:hypothetical protein